MRIKDGFTLEATDFGIYVARPDEERKKTFPNSIQMGLSGSVLWRELSGSDCTRAELLFALANLYEEDVDDSRLSADVDTFLDFLRQSDLLIE